MIIDSMGKWGNAWPKFDHDRPPTELERLSRPTMILTGALAHGWCTGLYMSLEPFGHGSAPQLPEDSCVMYMIIRIWSSGFGCVGLFHYYSPPEQDHFLEVLAETIEKVQALARQRGSQLPPHLVVVADNTPAGVKNSFGLRFLAYLVAKRLFRTATLFSLMVGHTHEACQHACVQWS